MGLKEEEAGEDEKEAGEDEKEAGDDEEEAREVQVTVIRDGGHTGRARSRSWRARGNFRGGNWSGGAAGGADNVQLLLEIIRFLIDSSRFQ